MTKPRLFAAGAAHMDRRGRVHAAYVAGASNPGTMREEIGGGAFNAMRNAVRHGVAGSLMSLRGGDVAGEAVARAIAAAGIEDRSATFLDRTTPSYTALLDEHGELIAGFADMGLYETGFARQMRRRAIRDAVAAADAVLCDANLPADAVARLARLAGDAPLYAIAISPAKVARLEPSLEHIACLFMNLREARRLTGDAAMTATEAARALRSRGLASGIITDGGRALTGFDARGIFTLSPPHAARIADVTGAGDAIAGVTVAGLMDGMELREAVRRGIAAARLTVESETVVAAYDDETFSATLALVAQARPVA
ncbi:carbohydrate kinase family protein [Mesorhizobium sp. CAU 1741]|uniref:carbohydrate kinase family protein n=1 Tax=Mesorhizobium sp. CAU 1741 TaxID=3140366 RepID=UPI00325A5BCF